MLMSLIYDCYFCHLNFKFVIFANLNKKYKKNILSRITGQIKYRKSLPIVLTFPSECLGQLKFKPAMSD